METGAKLSFREAAVASSLVTEELLAAAIASIETSDKQQTVAASDDHVARTLVERGVLNRWQVEQLKEGRTKFTLGPYRIVDSIGKGGMGHVFKGVHEMLGRVEAVKVLPKDRTSRETIETFQREIRAQAQLDHPNLVRVSYAGQDGDTYFLVTEYVPGADLRRLVRRHGRLTMHEAATIIAQAAQGLDYAHQQGLVHRDVKPGNLLVTPEGKTKVIDLGLAWYVDGADETDAHYGRLVGTADYLAPEMIRSPGEPLPESDIYALGCTLYYAVTGKVPFPGGRTSDKLRRHLEESPLDPRRINPDLSDMFLDVMADMMEKDPIRRVRSMQDVIERLRPWSLANVGITNPGAEAVLEVCGAAVDSNFAEKSDASSGDSLEWPSQISQGTSPLASWQEDTDSVQVRPRRHLHPQIGTRSRLSLAVLAFLAILSVAALVAVLL